MDRLLSCIVPAGSEWDRLSDHNPVVACFKPGRESRPTAKPT